MIGKGLQRPLAEAMQKDPAMKRYAKEYREVMAAA
jgi:hypothetical protein